MKTLHSNYGKLISSFLLLLFTHTVFANSHSTQISANSLGQVIWKKGKASCLPPYILAYNGNTKTYLCYRSGGRQSQGIVYYPQNAKPYCLEPYIGKDGRATTRRSTRIVQSVGGKHLCKKIKLKRDEFKFSTPASVNATTPSPSAPAPRDAKGNYYCVLPFVLVRTKNGAICRMGKK